MKLLVDERGNKRLCEGEVVHTDLGVVELAKASKGRVRSHLGHEFFVLEPRILDVYEEMPRVGSLILKKDLGAIIANTGVAAGDIVVDAGTGSGGLAIMLGSIVMPTGRVYTYEKRRKHAEAARKNIALAGLSDYVEVKLKDIEEGIDERPNVITLDLPEPWKIAENAHEVLKQGGAIAVYTPYLEQARKAHLALRHAGFKEVRTLETLEREIEFKKEGTRPRTRMLGHTAYLTFARKY
jgi:tRNA (adenine57-N1/adenine58-N1)-methyltransferase